MSCLYGQKDILATIERSKKPASNQFFLKPLQDQLAILKAMKNQKTFKDYANHVQCVIDGLNIFGWFLAVIRLHFYSHSPTSMSTSTRT